MPAFFTVNDAAFSPFMREQIEVRADAGVVTLRASVLLTQKDGSALSDMTGDTFAVQFLARDWSLLDLPQKGAVLLFGHPQRKLWVTSVQRVGGVIHMVASENLGY